MASLLRVLSGEVTIAGGTLSTSLALPDIDPTKSFIVAGLRPSAASPSEGLVTCQIDSPTQATFRRIGTGSVSNLLYWYVVEFSDGVSVQRGSAVITTVEFDIAIAPIDTDKSFVLTSWMNGGGTYGTDDFTRAALTSSSNLRFSIPFAATLEADWQVVTYEGCSVQRGTVAFSSTGTLAASTPLATAVDLATSWLPPSGWDTTQGSNNNIGQKLFRSWLTPSTVEVDRRNTGTTGIVAYEVVTFTDGTKVQSGDVAFLSADLQKDVTLAAPVDTTRAIATATGLMGRGGKTPYSSADNPSFAQATYQLTAADNLRIRRNTSGSTFDTTYFVVEFAVAAPTTRLKATAPQVSATGQGSLTKTGSLIAHAASASVLVAGAAIAEGALLASVAAASFAGSTAVGGVEATLSAATPSASFAGAASTIARGQLVASAPAVSASGVGAVIVEGQLSATVPIASAAVQAVSVNQASLTANALAPSVAASAQTTNTGTLVATTPDVSAAIHAQRGGAAILVSSAPAASVTTQATQPRDATLDATTPAPSVVAQASSIGRGILSASAPQALFTASGNSVNAASLSAHVASAGFAGVARRGGGSALVASVPAAGFSAQGAIASIAALNATTPAVQFQAGGATVIRGGLLASAPGVGFSALAAQPNQAALVATTPIATGTFAGVAINRASLLASTPQPSAVVFASKGGGAGLIASAPHVGLAAIGRVVKPSVLLAIVPSVQAAGGGAVIGRGTLSASVPVPNFTGLALLSVPDYQAEPERLFIVPFDERGFTVPLQIRLWAIDQQDRSFAVTMATTKIKTEKDPQARLDYALDWAEWLTGGDTIINSDWTTTGGLISDTPTFGPTQTTTWLSGGTPGTPASATNTITTALGRIEQRTINFAIKER